MLEVKKYKNYKELCVAMGWKVQSSNSKKKQLTELESLCKYHKEGNSFIIEEVYDVPKEIKETRGRNSLYAEQVGMAILNAVIAKSKSKNKKSEIVFFDKFQLVLSTDLANNRLFNNLSVDGFSDSEVRAYKTEGRNFVYQALNAGLNWLKKNKILMVHDNIIFGRNKDFTYEEIDQYKLPALLKIQQQLLLEMRPNIPANRRMGTIIFSNKLGDFKQKVIKQFNLMCNENYETYISRIRFVITDLSEEWAFKVLGDDLEIKQDLWESTHKALVKRAKNTQNKLKDKALDKQRNYELQKELNKRSNFDFVSDENSNNNRIEEIKGILEKSEISEDEYVNIIYTYEDYLDNFEALDRIFRRPQGIK